MIRDRTTDRTIFSAANGEVNFPGLRIERAATNVRLLFEAGNGLGPLGAFTGFEPFLEVPMVMTNHFDVLVGNIAKDNGLVMLVEPRGCSLDANRQGIPCKQSPVVELRDAGGNVVTADDNKVRAFFLCTRVIPRCCRSTLY
jgi:hypothetical protein